MQLGEHFPAALKLFAEAYGKTVPEMRKDMEKGIRGDEALRTMQKFFDGLDQRLKDNPKLWEKYLNSLKASQDSFKREWEIFMAVFFQSGFEEGMTKIFNRLSKFLKDNPKLAEALGRAFNALADAIVMVFNAIQKALDWWNSLDESTRDNILSAVKLVATFVILTNVLGRVLLLIEKLWKYLAAIGVISVGAEIVNPGMGEMDEYQKGFQEHVTGKYTGLNYGAQTAMGALAGSNVMNTTTASNTQNMTVYQTNNVSAQASADDVATALSNITKDTQNMFPRRE